MNTYQSSTIDDDRNLYFVFGFLFGVYFCILSNNSLNNNYSLNNSNR